MVSAAGGWEQQKKKKHKQPQTPTTPQKGNSLRKKRVQEVIAKGRVRVIHPKSGHKYRMTGDVRRERRKGKLWR